MPDEGRKMSSKDRDSQDEWDVENLDLECDEELSDEEVVENGSDGEAMDIDPDEYLPSPTQAVSE